MCGRNCPNELSNGDCKLPRPKATDCYPEEPKEEGETEYGCNECQYTWKGEFTCPMCGGLPSHMTTTKIIKLEGSED